LKLTRTELKKLAETKLKEVKALYENELYDGAYYASGYVLEFALKARICKILNIDAFPEQRKISKLFKTHNLKDLIFLAGLEKEFNNAKANNSNLLTNWSIISDWSEHLRYELVGSSQKESIEGIIEALEDPKDGVFTWIKKKW